MKRLIIMILIIINTTIVNAQISSHPRLFFSASEVSTLRSRATNGGTKSYELWTQILRDKEADYFAFGVQYSGGPSNKVLLIEDPWQMENFYSIALAYTITSNASYLNAARDIIFGYIDPNTQQSVVGLIYREPFEVPGYFDLFRYRVAQVTSLSMVTDLLWDSLTSNERALILQKVKQEVDYIDPSGSKQGVREFVFSGYAHIQNNHLARYGKALLFAAITFFGNDAYPQAATDIDRMRQLFVTNLNGNKNIIERLYDSEGGQVEGVEYSLVGITSIIPIIQVLKLWDGVDYFANEEIQKRLSKFSNWLAYETLPAPRSYYTFFNNINDSDIGAGFPNPQGLLTGILLLGGYYQTNTVPWVFQNTAQTVSNLQTVSLQSLLDNLCK